MCTGCDFFLFKISFMILQVETVQTTIMSGWKKGKSVTDHQQDT